MQHCLTATQQGHAYACSPSDAKSSIAAGESEPVLLRRFEGMHYSTVVLRLRAASLHRPCLPALLAFRRSGGPWQHPKPQPIVGNEEPPGSPRTGWLTAL